MEEMRITELRFDPASGYGDVLRKTRSSSTRILEFSKNGSELDGIGSLCIFPVYTYYRELSAISRDRSV